jgi:hypothetical protein
MLLHVGFIVITSEITYILNEGQLFICVQV